MPHLTRIPKSRAFWLPLLLAGALSSAAHAQIGGTTDILTGLVVGPDSQPMADVIIEALSLETQITRTTTTDARGRYTLLFPDGGGQYRITARFIGMAPRQYALVRYADEDRLVWDVQMSSQPMRLTDIEIRAFLTPVRIPDRPTPGSVERSLSATQIANLPIDASDLNLLATLVPGVVGIDATDSTGAAFSVAGQRQDANAITLDGLTFGSGQVPQEGLRNTRIVTSTYDVSRGRFSGGLISAITRGGTNRIQGSLNYSLRDDDLAFQSGDASPFTSGFTQNQLGGGLGGPIVGNRLFAYGSFQGLLRSDPLTSLTAATSTDLQRLGVAPDSVSRFMSIANDFGLSPRLTSTTRSNANFSGLLRFDYLISNDHTLTVRGDLQQTRQDPSRSARLGLPETGGVATSSGNGLMVSLASRLGLEVLNQFRAYAGGSRQNSDPFLYLPQGRVQVASNLVDGSTGITTLVLGGNPSMPTQSSNTIVEVTDEISWLPGNGAHRIKLGGVFTAQRNSNIRSNNRLGTFTFNSLTDLESSTPASFRRTLTPNERTTQSYEAAAYAGDVWRVSRGLQLTYGLRLESSSFTRPPAYNPALDAALGRRTDELPSELHLSPRLGFTWTVGGGTFGTPPDIVVRGGAGLFRSPMPSSLVGFAQSSTGLSTSESELNCIGAAVPISDWLTYLQDDGAIPAACAGGASAALARTPTATVFSDSYTSPKAWRASLSLQRNLTSLLRLTISGNYARGVNQYGFNDINLNTNQGFVLTNEANRPVFVDPTSVVPRTGAVRLNDSRIDPQFGQVLEIVSDLGSETKQLTVGLGGLTRGGIVLQTSYTWSSVHDQVSSAAGGGFGARAGRRGGGGGGGGGGNLGSSTTAGNPNIKAWSRSSLERKHSFLATVRYPFGTALEVTAIGRLTSGTPYTPRVGSDINGDGARNDRAFIYDPANAPSTAVADGMSQLLATTSAGGRSCLQQQLGKLAERNSCTGPWQGSLDLQFNYRPNFLGLNGNLTVSVTTMNMLRGIDELFHGAENAKGWGLRARPDQTLLFVNGFDPATQAYQYAVNERFGATNPGANANRTPFQIGIQARYSFGPNRVRDAIDRIRGGGRGGGFREGGGGGLGRGRGFGGGGGGRGRGITGPDFLDRFRSLLVNPADLVLGLSDSLNLSDAQVADIEAVRDSLEAQNEALAAELQQQIEEAGTEQNTRALLGLIQPKFEAAREVAQNSLEDLRRVLTDEQWELLPDAIKSAADAVRLRGQNRRRR